jgi:hypothetical protein
MPRKSKRQSQTRFAISGRWLDEDQTDEMEVDSVSEMKKPDENGHGSLENMDLLVVGDLFEMCKSDCGSRKLSVLLYMLLRVLGRTWRSTDEILRQIGAFRCRHAHKWAETFLSGDFDSFASEGRGGKVSPSFYDVYPDLEMEAKTFAVEGCSRKNASFTVTDLAKFVDEKYYDITQQVKTSDDLVRAESTC